MIYQTKEGGGIGPHMTQQHLNRILTQRLVQIPYTKSMKTLLLSLLILMAACNVAAQQSVVSPSTTKIQIQSPPSVCLKNYFDCDPRILQPVGTNIYAIGCGELNDPNDMNNPSTSVAEDIAAMVPDSTLDTSFTSDEINEGMGNHVTKSFNTTFLVAVDSVNGALVGGLLPNDPNDPYFHESDIGTVTHWGSHTYIVGALDDLTALIGYDDPNCDAQ